MEVYDVALIPLILAVVTLAKKTGLPQKYSPLVSAFLGVAAGVIYVYPDDIKGGVLVGLSLGLAATGLYSGTKNVKEGVIND